MSRTESIPSKPVAVPLFGLALGVVMLLVAWLAAGDLWLGLGFLGIMTVYAGVLRFGQRFEAVQILSRDRQIDERLEVISLHAITWAYSAVVIVAVLGFFWEVAQGTPGPFTLVAAVAGSTHIVATIVLRSRR